MSNRHSPGEVRDAILAAIKRSGGEADIETITASVGRIIGEVPSSSIRSYLRLNTEKVFERVSRGRYRIATQQRLPETSQVALGGPLFSVGKAKYFLSDSFRWMQGAAPCSFEAIVTDPPYGVVEFSELEVKKLRSGKGGVWRIPPSFDGITRSPLPRFTTLSDKDRTYLRGFFLDFGKLAGHVLVPGGHAIVASNPLLSHLVASALEEAGLELRGYVSRLVMTMRGGDRPKNAHEEFSDVTVMPRSMWEPWVIARKPLEGRVQDNLRRWRTGGLRRISGEKPFGDVIESHPTRSKEREIAPHPALKPQAFMRQIVRAALPLGEGRILDPFAGAGSTLAAANFVGYESVGIELDPEYAALAEEGIQKLQVLKT